MAYQIVYIHIGLCKTGTTSLQHWLSANRDQLKTQGFLYPKTGIESHHHFRVASLFLDNHVLSNAEKASLEEALCEEIKEWENHLIFCSEHFSFIKEDKLHDLAELIGADAKIIVCLRQQVTWASAMYAEFVRWNPSGDFGSYLGSGVIDLDYDRYVGRWEKVFGLENIKVFPYEKEFVTKNILKHIGVEKYMFSDDNSIQRMHKTLPGLLVEIQRIWSQGRSNGFEIEDNLKDMHSRIEKSGQTLAQESRIPDTFRSMFEGLDENNNRVSRRYGLASPLFDVSVEDALKNNISCGYARGGRLSQKIIEAIVEHGFSSILDAL